MSRREAPAPTLAELQVELGSDNAYSLVEKIGELALSQGLGQAGGSVEGAVDRVLGSLTREERLTMAAGGMPPRAVCAMHSIWAKFKRACR